MLSKMSEFADKFSKVLQFLGLLITIVVSIFLSVNKAIDNKLEENNKKMYELLLSKTAPLEDYIYTQIVLSIDKQYYTYKNDKTCLRASDVEMILKNYRRLPDSYKTDDIKLKYDYLLRWYADK